MPEPIQSINDLAITRLDGTASTVAEITGGRPALVVNVASKCGLTPQYAGLEELQNELSPRGFTVVGVPCNQFGGQEPGTAAEIETFCSTTYGVTFPMTEKVEVNGEDRHPIYSVLTELADSSGRDGDILWNFEKFLLDGQGRPVARFAPTVTPEDPALRSAIAALLD